MRNDIESARLSAAGRRVAWGIAATAAVLIGASAAGLDLGLPTCAAALIANRAVGSEIVAVSKGVSWTVLPLVAGLFVLVAALDGAGAVGLFGGFLLWCAGLPPLAGSIAASCGVTTLANVMNNLPSGLLAGSALQGLSIPNYLRHAVLLGTDLGPNLSVTGSLATLLWLLALRREGVNVSGWTFLKVGALVMPPALLLSAVALAFSAI